MRPLLKLPVHRYPFRNIPLFSFFIFRFFFLFSRFFFKQIFKASRAKRIYSLYFREKNIYYIDLSIILLFLLKLLLVVIVFSILIRSSFRFFRHSLIVSFGRYESKYTHFSFILPFFLSFFFRFFFCLVSTHAFFLVTSLTLSFQ